ncbi:MAG: hypothetical protein Q8P56_04570 [Candidatus Uhrbacteria bacterium]|nr:hypothetical protein [Candidatus Uhrbacteria bacterium]
MRHTIVVFLSIIIGIEACLVILGWGFGVEQLTRITPIGINMKFPTAVTFLATAVGLYYISRTAKENHDVSQIILPGIALFIFAYMSALFASAALGVTTGLDSPFTIEGRSVFTAGAGMPALPTMINFVLFGFASIVSLFPGTKQRRATVFFGSCIFILGLIGALGYILHIPALYYQFSGPFVPIAFNTAILFVLLGAGLIVIGKEKK